MRRFLLFPALVAMFVIANASPTTIGDKPSIPMAPSSALAAVAMPSTKVVTCGEVSAARQPFDPQPRAVCSLLGHSPLSMLPLKAHRASARIAATGHIKFRHASNAPPVLFC